MPKERDFETGLDYMGARFFASFDARFLSIDPSPGNLQNPQSQNRYNYTLNNPLKYVDPKGRAPWFYIDGMNMADPFGLSGSGARQAEALMKGGAVDFPGMSDSSLGALGIIGFEQWSTTGQMWNERVGMMVDVTTVHAKPVFSVGFGTEASLGAGLGWQGGITVGMVGMRNPYNDHWYNIYGEPARSRYNVSGIEIGANASAALNVSLGGGELQDSITTVGLSGTTGAGFAAGIDFSWDSQGNWLVQGSLGLGLGTWDVHFLEGYVAEGLWGD